MSVQSETCVVTQERQLTLRALSTGAVLGALLTPCNVYSGLKIGWSFNMSIAAALLSCGFWGAVRRVGGEHRVAHWGLLENNVNQTCASSAAS
ncbi:MAG: OPT/YSL family transporter, partial [Planctomycetales bacterium]|nr:OPT/YSL family transporter [Planctomycetales bacterium]